MNQYLAKNIINLAVAGHGGAGKTSLAEAMLYAQRKKPVTDRKWAEKFLYPNNPMLRISVPNRE